MKICNYLSHKADFDIMGTDYSDTCRANGVEILKKNPLSKFMPVRIFIMYDYAAKITVTCDFKF